MVTSVQCLGVICMIRTRVLATLTLALSLFALSLTAPATAITITEAPSAHVTKKKSKGTLTVNVSGTGSYMVTGPGWYKTGQGSQTFKVKPGKYVITVTDGTADRSSVRVRKGKTVTVNVTFSNSNNNNSNNNSNQNGGSSSGGAQVGRYTCYGGGTFSYFWIDSASKYRSAGGTSGDYKLDSGTTAIITGAIKIDFLTGTYADWELDTPPFRAEYLPVGATMSNGTVATKPAVYMSYNPSSSGSWVTCDHDPE